MTGGSAASRKTLALQSSRQEEGGEWRREEKACTKKLMEYTKRAEHQNKDSFKRAKETRDGC